MEKSQRGSLANDRSVDCDGKTRRDNSTSLPYAVDVLIIGSGPAGLTLATQLAQIPGIDFLLIEREPTKLQRGHADGLQVRSLEIFQALGFAEAVVKEAYYVKEMTFWEPDGKGGIYRASRCQDTLKGTSEMPHVILTQARLHDHFLNRLSESINPATPNYKCAFKGLEHVTHRPGEYNEVVIEQTDGHGQTKSHHVKAKFVIGCDGARSPLRHALDLPMHGERNNHIWGVMDAVADTDFPDIRFKVGIRSATEGAILIIPKADREHTVARIYAELDQVEAESAGHGEITQETIVSKAQRILSPYKYEVKEILWWSRYEIGQRLCKTFDNSKQGGPPPTIFIAGDACHTHSPKAGQGMNVSIADTFNLGWKLAAVVRGQAASEILRTYSSERQVVAQELIEFDQHLTKVFSSRAESKDKDELRKAHADKAAFMAGVGVQYDKSPIQGAPDPRTQSLAVGFPVGKRFHSAQVLRCADACPVHLGHCLVADGRWRLVVFAGADAPNDRSSRSWRLFEWLENSQESPVKKYTPRGEDIDSTIEILSVYTASHPSFDLSNVPSILWPRQQRHQGARDYRKVYTNWWDGGEEIEDIHELRGINKCEGAIVIVRPDQYVAQVLDLDHRDELCTFFGGFLLERS